MTALMQERGQCVYYKYGQTAEDCRKQTDGDKQRVQSYFHDFQTGTSSDSVKQLKSSPLSYMETRTSAVPSL